MRAIVSFTYAACRSALTVSGPGLPPVPRPTSVTHTFFPAATRWISFTRLATASGVAAYGWTAATSNGAPAFTTSDRNCRAGVPRWLVGSPAATISAFASTLWIAAPVWRSRSAYAAESGFGAHHAVMLGSFQICQDVIGSFGVSGWSFQNEPSGP